MAQTLLDHLFTRFCNAQADPLTPEQQALLDACKGHSQEYLDNLQSIASVMGIPGFGMRLDDGVTPLEVQLRTKARDSVVSAMDENAHKANLTKSMSGGSVIQAFDVPGAEKGG